MKYEVYGVVRASKYLGTVEADTKEEAEEKAWSDLDAYVSLCHQCSSEAEEAEISELVINQE